MCEISALIMTRVLGFPDWLLSLDATSWIPAKPAILPSLMSSQVKFQTLEVLVKSCDGHMRSEVKRHARKLFCETVNVIFTEKAVVF